MAITLQYLLKQLNHNEMRCVAGFRGLEKKIENVNVIDNPEIMNWLKGGELVVSTGYITYNNIAMQRTLVKDLVNKGAVGLGIKINRFYHEIPSNLIEEGNKYEFPIFEISYETRMSDIMKLVYANFFSDTMSESEKETLLYKQVTSSVLKDEKIDSALFNIGLAIENSVLLVDDKFNLIGYENHENSNIELIQYFQLQIGECAIPLAMSNYIMEYYHESRFKLHKTLMNSEKDSISVMFVPVALHERLMGFLIIVQTVTELEKVNYSVLETSMRILGIHLLEEKLQADSRAFSQDSFLNSVLMNQYSNDAMIRYNCDIWGFDYLMNRICVYVEIDNYLNLPYFKRNRIGDVFNNIKRRVVQEYGMKEYSMPFREGYILFFLFSADLENVEIRDMAIKAVNMFVQEMEKEKCSIHIGISSVGKRLQHISEAFKQSVDILALGRKLYPDRTEYFYQDLLAYHFLYNSLTIEKLVSIYNDTVAVVDEYDQKNNTDLLETLDIYLENDCNTSKAAEQLHLHRNTMMYRLEKIQDILQTEITGSDHNFNIRLGIRAKKIMNLYKINNKTVQSNE